MSRGRRESLFVLCLVILMGIAARYQIGQQSWAASRARRAMASAALVGETAPEQERGDVTLLGSWTGPEQESLRALVQRFTEQSGATVNLESTPDIVSVLAARVKAGTPPDIAILPGTGLLREYAAAGQLRPLAQALDVDRLGEEYPEGWLEMGRVDGQLYGLVYRLANESIVWYSPEAFRQHHWTVPLTWGELLALSERVASVGLTSWSLALEDSSRGDMGTDWIENIILRLYGPDTYDRWVRHEIAWTDPAVRQAFLHWGQIVRQSGHAAGASRQVLQTGATEAVGTLYRDIPEAYLCLGGSFLQPLIAQEFPQRTQGEDYDFFPLPSMDGVQQAPVVVSADVLVMFRRTPQSGALLRYLISREGQMAWVQRGGLVSASRRIRLSDYPDALSRRAARQVLEAQTLRFDGSEEMPPALGHKFRSMIHAFVADPAHLDSLLQSLEDMANDLSPSPP